MLKKSTLLFILVLSIASPVYAAPTTESLQLSVDLVWVMVAAFLVFFMHAGFPMRVRFHKS